MSVDRFLVLATPESVKDATKEIITVVCSGVLYFEALQGSPILDFGDSRDGLVNITQELHLKPLTKETANQLLEMFAACNSFDSKHYVESTIEKSIEEGRVIYFYYS